MLGTKPESSARAASTKKGCHFASILWAVNLSDFCAIRMLPSISNISGFSHGPIHKKRGASNLLSLDLIFSVSLKTSLEHVFTFLTRSREALWITAHACQWLSVRGKWLIIVFNFLTVKKYGPPSPPHTHTPDCWCF